MVIVVRLVGKLVAVIVVGSWKVGKWKWEWLQRMRRLGIEHGHEHEMELRATRLTIRPKVYSNLIYRLKPKG